MQGYPKISHYGAVTGVTGSCHRYKAAPEFHCLIDCGLFQGVEQESAEHDAARQSLEIDFDISQVGALIVTHVHIDHIGRLPYLMAAGFKGPIYCSIPSEKLLPLVIEDALKIGFTRDKGLIDRFLNKVDSLLRPLPYGEWHIIQQSVASLLKIKLQRAGHILGSAYVELDVTYKAPDKRSHRTVFSGDLGAPYAPLLPAPRSPYKADTLVIESTYGDRNHEGRRLRKLRLKKAVEHALGNGGTVIVPAFSIGRTQELLYELEGLIQRGSETWQKLQIIVDSPLAAKFTNVYRELIPYWDAEAKQRLARGRHPLSFENLYTVDGHDEHLQIVEYLNSTKMPAIVLAASGMANGGRVLNYIKAMIEDPRHCVLFVGYQARGTIGSIIQRFGPTNGWVEIDGNRYNINAEVTTISGYSAHADQTNLLNFVKRMRHWPSSIRVVHGDEEAKHELADKLKKLYMAKGKAVKILIPTT